MDILEICLGINHKSHPFDGATQVQEPQYRYVSEFPFLGPANQGLLVLAFPQCAYGSCIHQ